MRRSLLLWSASASTPVLKRRPRCANGAKIVRCNKMTQPKPPPIQKWDSLHGTYLTGRSFIDGAQALQIEMEKKWGADRLRLLVSQELREKFDRQRYLLRQAIEFGPLENVRRESERMRTALYALDGAAKANGASPIDAEVMEIALNSGTVLAIVGDQDDARRAFARSDGRRMIVYTLEELAVILSDYPSVNATKQVWPGATVTKVTRRVSDPLEVIAHPTGLDDPMDDLWTTEQDV